MTTKSSGRPYRPGPLGALMDEYERAVRELATVVGGLSEEELARVRDPEAEDPQFRSIRTVMRHVVRAGYGHVDSIRKALGDPIERPTVELASPAGVVAQLDALLAHTEAAFGDRWEMTEDEMDAVTFEAPWGLPYTMEQMLEHTLVHVLRHRRQIERWLGGPG